MLQDGPFIRLISSSKRGLGGVELWLQKDTLEQAFKCTIDATKDIMVWSQDERHLAAHIQVGAFVFDCIVCYAPQKGRETSEIECWWEEIAKVVEERTWKAPLFMMGDMNCRIGSVTTEGIQSLAADLEDAGGTCLRELCDKHALTIPSTFSTLHKGNTNTYTGTRGHQTRNDYIAIPDECVAGVVSSHVDGDIDLLNGNHDHAVIALELSILWRNQQAFGAKKVFTYDRQAARAYKKVKACQDAIAPMVPWRVDVNEHWDQIREAYRSYATKFFPKPKRQKRQLYLSEKAWNILCAKKDNKQEFLEIKRAKRRQLLHSIFKAWRNPESQPQAFDDLQWTITCQREAVTLEKQIQLDQAFKQQKRADWTAWTEAKMEELVTQTNRVKGAEVFKVIQPKRIIDKANGKLRRPLPGLRDGSGTWQHSRTGIADAWQGQFSNIENAEPTTMTELRERTQPNCEPKHISLLKNIPTIYDYEKAVRGMADSKAAGADGIGAELLQLNPGTNVPQLYSLMVKSATRAQVPAEMCGEKDLLASWKAIVGFYWNR